MDKIGSFIGSIGTLLRDIFLYFMPAIPFILVAVPLLQDLGLLNLDIFTTRVHFLSRPVMLEISIVVLVYLVGRTLNALSYPLFWLYRSTIGKLPLKSIKDWKDALTALDTIDSDMVYAKVMKYDKDVYNHLIERHVIISMSEQSLSTASFLIGILLVACGLFGCATIPIGLLTIYALGAFTVSLLFVFMDIATETELYKTTRSLNALPLT